MNNFFFKINILGVMFIDSKCYPSELQEKPKSSSKAGRKHVSDMNKFLSINNNYDYYKSTVDNDLSHLVLTTAHDIIPILKLNL